MDFALRSGEGFVEEEDDDQIPNHHRHRPMSFSSTSAASPSSSSQYRSINLINSNAEMGSWLGTRFDPKAGAASSDNLNPMSSSSPDRDTEPGNYASIEKEHMFDKVVTPSDVGKLNRLVIPKQHAEKYFPLDSSTNEKGLLLNFEDREGKPWRFRYSYWNSSQSYVMTKGWSRFVKEKKLDAGDIVSFQRGVGDAAKDRLFIDWRRRPDGPHDVGGGGSGHGGLMPGQYFRSIQYPWTATAPAAAAAAFSPPQLLYRPGTVMMTTDRRRDWGGPGFGYGNVVYLRSNPGAVGPPAAAAAASPIVFESVPVVQGKAAAKRLRLFGVNMDCPVSESDEECEILSSTSMASQPPKIQFSSSPTTMQPPYPIPPQLRLFNGTPLMSSSKGKQTSTSSSSSMSLDFDIN